MNSTLVCSHTIKGLVHGVTILALVFILSVSMFGIHMIPDISQLITHILTLKAMVTVVPLDECLGQR